MSFSAWVALAAVIATIYGLIKRYETRLVLLLAGLVMCCCSLDPMAAFEQFDKSMTNRALIISICSSMGFAACVTLTKCDLHLVSLLTKPLNKLGILLLPCCMLVTGVASLAIGSLPAYAQPSARHSSLLCSEQASDRRSPLLPLFPPHFRIIGLRDQQITFWSLS